MIFGIPIRSIRIKFLLAGLTAVLVSGLFSFFLAADQGQQLEQELHSSAFSTSKQTAFLMAPFIAFDSRAEMSKALEMVRANPDFASAAVFGETGERLASAGLPPAARCDSGAGQHLLHGDGYLLVSTPIVDGNKIWGCLQLQFSEARSRRNARQLWTIMIAASFMSILVTLGSGIYLAQTIAYPVTRLAEAVSRVQHGEWDIDLEVHSRDEIGLLARSFRSMIRELKRSKGYVDDIIHFMADSLIVVDQEGKISSANPATCALLGYEEKELIGQPVGQIIQGIELWEKARLRGEETSSGIEIDYAAHDGSRIPVLTSVARMGPSNTTICMAQDLREHKRVERELLSAKDAAESANRAKSAFLATMSHEIRTPLNAILGYSQLMLRDSELGSGAKENLNIINRSGAHLLALINDILDVCKIEAGQAQLNLAHCNLSELVNDLEVMFRLRAETKGLRLHVLISPDCPKSIEADGAKLRQVLVNLLGNAVKFTARGSICLQMSMLRRDDGELCLAVEVQDTGTGISAEEQAGLFRPFAQADSGRNLQGGTGLGLAISRQFARLMGGEVTLASEPGKGSTFHLVVPVRPCGAEVVSRKQAESLRVLSLESKEKAPRILVVDDEPDNRGWLTRLLTIVGFVVREAVNGAEAVRLWQEWRPDLILMDVRMPVIDGLEATQKIRQQPGGQETVIIALTASALDDSRNMVMQSGVNDFLSKPCQENQLMQKLQSSLNLTFVYEDTACPPTAPHGESGSRVRLFSVRDLPPQLIGDLRMAIQSGEKDRLDELIEEAAECDAGVSRSLKALADNYEYAALTHLMEGAEA